MSGYRQTLDPTYQDDPGAELRYASEQPAPKPSPSVSGSTVLQLAAGSTARPSSGQQVCRWQADDAFPSALVLHVDVRSTASGSPSSPFASQAVLLAQGSGAAQGTGTETGGVLRVTYGQGSTMHVLDCDVRSGSYQIPPCTSCTVEAFAWLAGPLSPVNLSCSLVPGRLLTAGRLTHSLRSTLAGGASVTEKVPYGARWVGLLGGGSALGAGQPQVSLVQAGGGARIVHDWSGSTFLVAPGSATDLGDRSDVTISNWGTVATSVITRFYLET